MPVLYAVMFALAVAGAVIDVKLPGSRVAQSAAGVLVSFAASIAVVIIVF